MSLRIIKSKMMFVFSFPDLLDFLVPEDLTEGVEQAVEDRHQHQLKREKNNK